MIYKAATGISGKKNHSILRENGFTLQVISTLGKNIVMWVFFTRPAQTKADLKGELFSEEAE